MLVCKSVYVWAHDLSINAGEDRTNIPVEFEFSLMNSYIGKMKKNTLEAVCDQSVNVTMEETCVEFYFRIILADENCSKVKKYIKVANMSDCLDELRISLRAAL